MTTEVKMPFIEDALPTSASGHLSPLRSNLEDMIISCGALNKRIALLSDDKETYGMLTEESYCYDVPVRHALTPSHDHDANLTSGGPRTTSEDLTNGTHCDS